LKNHSANQRRLELLLQEYGSMAGLRNRKIVKMIASPGGNKRWMTRELPSLRHDAGEACPGSCRAFAEVSS
jgi:hypothetical protein